jgi:hypothetical protein
VSRADTQPAARVDLDAVLDELRRSARRADALASAADHLASDLPIDDRRGRTRLLTMIELVRIGVEEVVATVDRVVAGVERVGARP